MNIQWYNDNGTTQHIETRKQVGLSLEVTVLYDPNWNANYARIGFTVPNFWIVRIPANEATPENAQTLIQLIKLRYGL